MTAAEVVRARILQIAAVTALVGTRVYTLKFPQTFTAPAIRVQTISGIEDEHLRGSGSLRQARVQVDVAAVEASGSDPYATASAIQAAVRGGFLAGVATGLNGWAGTVAGVEVLSLFADQPHEQYDPDELKMVMLSQDYRLSYRG